MITMAKMNGVRYHIGNVVKILEWTKISRLTGDDWLQARLEDVQTVSY